MIAVEVFLQTTVTFILAEAIGSAEFTNTLVEVIVKFLLRDATYFYIATVERYILQVVQVAEHANLAKLRHTRQEKAALPIVDIITLAATGSEYDCGGVISRTETNDKIGYMDPHLYPMVSFLDPTYTFTVSKKQTAAGCADAMNHIMEQYFCEDSTLLNDGFMEAGLKSLMYNAKKCLDAPEDYTARAE